MITYHIVERPAFDVIGKTTWISGQDNELFGRFWAQCKEQGLFERFEEITGFAPGPQTGGVTLGVSCVDEDPARRQFDYMIGVEKPEGYQDVALQSHHVPAATWAVFACRGPVPGAIVEAEIFAFTEWLPASDYVHANAPEMEVYPAGPDGQSDDAYNEFWLPIRLKDTTA